MKTLAMAFLVVSIFLSGMAIVYSVAPEDVLASTSISQHGAMVILENAQANHQYFLDHPEDIKDGSGNVTFHTLWVKNYQAVIEWMEAR